MFSAGCENDHASEYFFSNSFISASDIVPAAENDFSSYQPEVGCGMKSDSISLTLIFFFVFPFSNLTRSIGICYILHFLFSGFINAF